MSAHLVVASMLVEQRDYGFDVSSLNDVQSLRTFYQDTVEDFQNTWEIRQNTCHDQYYFNRPHLFQTLTVMLGGENMCLP